MCDVIQEKMPDGCRRLNCRTHQATLIEPTAEQEKAWCQEHPSEFCVCRNQSHSRIWAGVCVICEKEPMPRTEAL